MKNHSKQKHLNVTSEELNSINKNHEKVEENKVEKPTTNCESRLVEIDSTVIQSKIFDRVSGCAQISNELDEFKKIHMYSFNDSIGFYTARAVVELQNSLTVKDWKINAKHFKIMNDNDFCPKAVDTKKIVNEFLNQESISAMERILVGPGTNQYDSSIVDNIDENRKSLFFSKENCEIVKYYYSLFIRRFPLTIDEFEKAFFYFLTLTMQTCYPIGLNFNDAYNYVKKVNQKVTMRFIDVENEFVQLLLFILSYDNELKCECERIYQDYNRHWRLAYEQTFLATS